MLRAAETTQKTDTGRQRRGNEDSSLAHPPRVRRRRRDGRSAGGRGRLTDRGRGICPGLAGRRHAGGAPRGPCPGGEQADLRSVTHRTRARRHGHDADGGAARRRARGDRPRRRQPRVPVPRRHASAADKGSFARRRAGAARQADRGAGRGAPAAIDHHPRAGPRADRRRRHRQTIRCARTTCCCCAATVSPR